MKNPRLGLLFIAFSLTMLLAHLAMAADEGARDATPKKCLTKDEFVAFAVTIKAMPVNLKNGIVGLIPGTRDRLHMYRVNADEDGEIVNLCFIRTNFKGTI